LTGGISLFVYKVVGLFGTGETLLKLFDLIVHHSANSIESRLVLLSLLSNSNDFIQ
jgi:hypothetical protein